MHKNILTHNTYKLVHLLVHTFLHTPPHSCQPYTYTLTDTCTFTPITRFLIITQIVIKVTNRDLTNLSHFACMSIITNTLFHITKMPNPSYRQRSYPAAGWHLCHQLSFILPAALLLCLKPVLIEDIWWCLTLVIPGFEWAAGHHVCVIAVSFDLCRDHSCLANFIPRVQEGYERSQHTSQVSGHKRAHAQLPTVRYAHVCPQHKNCPLQSSRPASSSKRLMGHTAEVVSEAKTKTSQATQLAIHWKDESQDCQPCLQLHSAQQAGRFHMATNASFYTRFLHRHELRPSQPRLPPLSNQFAAHQLPAQPPVQQPTHFQQPQPTQYLPKYLTQYPTNASPQQQPLEQQQFRQSAEFPPAYCFAQHGRMMMMCAAVESPSDRINLDDDDDTPPDLIDNDDASLPTVATITIAQCTAWSTFRYNPHW